ncbi:MAG TPA: VOC family protein [Chloroflexota bacterium]|jgi:catechol 2,3-dioxygenase-like lactoylglutathione lyase family enzyme
MAVTTEAPVIERMHHWTLVSTDIERTKRWYTEVLGAKPIERREGGPGGPTSVTLANVRIDFFRTNEEYQPMPGSEGQHHAYAIKQDDWDTWVERFNQFGIPIRFANMGTSNSMWMTVDDPDGYHIELRVVMDTNRDARGELLKRGVQFDFRGNRPQRQNS